MIKVLVWLGEGWVRGWLLGHHGAMVLVQYAKGGQSWHWHWEIKEEQDQ